MGPGSHPHLSPLRLKLGTQGSGPAQFFLQLSRALRVAGVALLQLPHLPSKLPQLAQAAPAAVQRGFKLPGALGGLPGGRGKWEEDVGVCGQWFSLDVRPSGQGKVSGQPWACQPWAFGS